MAYNLKEESKKKERLTGGHRMCAGCGAPITVRCVLRALNEDDHAVISASTGCLEVSTCLYPYTAWEDSFIHSAFENAAATISGAQAAYESMKRRGKIKDNVKFIAFGGDGGTYDIGLQSLSGAMERGHDMVYVCYDNGAYMNTGTQRSSATPIYADTSTSPVGRESNGKPQFKKDLTMIMAEHNIPYVAQTTIYSNLKDMHEKAYKAIYTKGPAFLNVMAPCPRGWRYDTPKLYEICRLAMDTCIWPVYEIEEGKLKINYKPKEKLSVERFLEPQGRFKHLLREENQHLVKSLQEEVDKRWERLLTLESSL